MTMFSKPRDRQPVTPEPCHRCHVRPGTLRLQVVSPDESPSRAQSGGAAAGALWLCDECRARTRGGGGERGN